MRTINTFYLALLLVFIIACTSDDEPLTPAGPAVTVEFPADLSVMEEAGNHEIFINFDRPAPSDGIITVKLTSGEDVEFETIPALLEGEMEIEVFKGDTRASFFLIPGENGVLEDNKTLVFQLAQSSQGFLLGNKKVLNISILEDEQAAKTDFISVYLLAQENNSEPLTVEIDILGEAPGNGMISIQVEDPVGDLFTTNPAFDSNHIINLEVPSGATRVSFEIQPKDDAILKAHHNFTFRIIEASGSVAKGDLSTMTLKLLDDELYGKPKTAETVNSEGKFLKTLEYDELGRISKVKTESYTPGYFGKTETYGYNENGQLEYISSFPGEADHFKYSQGKVVEIEHIIGFFKAGYSLIDYNAAGEIVKKTVFEVKTSGEEVPKALYTYSYYNDGNLQSYTYSVPGEQNSWQPVSSRTYSSYNATANPFPLEVFPTQPVQPFLPGFMDVEENGERFHYYYAVDYNNEGQIARRRASNETVTYTYY